MLNRTTALHYAALLAFAAALLLARVDLSIPLGNYLWGEDANVFMNQAGRLGLAGIVTPHAGYVVAYPRLIAWFADAFPLTLRPALYAVGWISAYTIMVLLLDRGAKMLGISALARFIFVGLAVLQPHNGESLLNLTNSQWMIGVGLAVFALTQREQIPVHPRIGVPLLTLLGLTGPYALILTPALVLRWRRERWPLRTAWWAIVLIACGMLQALVAASTGHFRTIPAAAEQMPFPWNWLYPIGQIAAFGAAGAFERTAAIAMWLAAIFAVVHARRAANAVQLRFDLLALMIAAASFVGASLIAFRANPAFIAPYVVGNRYTWAPFILFFLAAFVATNTSRNARLVVIATGLVICSAGLTRKSAAEMHFAAFANLAQYRPVTIPISPPRERFPNWFIDANPQPGGDDPRIEPIRVTPKDVAAVNVDGAAADGAVVWTGNDPQLILTSALTCTSSRDIGVEIELQRSTPGWLQLFWDAQADFREERSFRRWYPDGVVTAQFAFRSPAETLRLRFDPAEIPGNAALRSISVYCLK